MTPPPQTASTIARDSAVVGAGAAASRVLGFVRDVMIAALLGAGPAADALLVALRIPNLVRRVVGEGAVNGAFTPVHQRVEAEHGMAAARRFAGESIICLAIGVLILTAAAQTLAPWIVLALAGSFADDPDRLRLATSWTRWTLALVPATALSALCAALLASKGRLQWAALAPAAVNAGLVLVLAALARLGAPPEAAGLAAAVSVSLAGLIQLAIVAAPLLGAADRPSFSRPTLSPPLRRAAALALPGLATAASAQLSILAALYLASEQPSALSQLHYADRLFQLPLGFVAAGAGVVLLNEVVRLVQAGHTGAVAPVIDQAILLALLLALPAAAGLLALAQPIASVLFERGAFTSADTTAVASAIRGLSFGLPAAALARVLAQPFLAAERSRPPLLAALAALAVTILAGLLLRAGHGVAGLGAAVSLGAWADALVLGLALGSSGQWRPGRRLVGRAALATAAAAAMGISVLLSAHALAPWLAVEAPLPVRGGLLALLCAGGAIAYAAMMLACGAGQWRKSPA